MQMFGWLARREASRVVILTIPHIWMALSNPFIPLVSATQKVNYSYWPDKRRLREDKNLLRSPNKSVVAFSTILHPKILYPMHIPLAFYPASGLRPGAPRSLIP